MQDTGSIASMNQHKWGTEKTDVATTAEVKNNKHAQGKPGKYKVNLANGFERELQTVTRPMSRAYHYYLRAGMAWKDGERLISNTALVEFLGEMQEHLTAMNEAKAALLPKLPALITKAVQLNADLGNAADYPAPADILACYYFDFDFEPIASTDAFGSLPDGFKDKFSDNYSNKLQRRIKDGTDDIASRLAKLITDFVGVLGREKPKFFQSTLDNITQLTATLRGANLLARDAALVQVCTALDMVVQYTADQLRDNMSARIAVQASCNACVVALSSVLGSAVEAAPSAQAEPTELDTLLGPAEETPTDLALEIEQIMDDVEARGEAEELLGDLIPELILPVETAPPEAKTKTILEEVAGMEIPEEDEVDDDIASLFTDL
jgi:hypothetical protein